MGNASAKVRSSIQNAWSVAKVVMWSFIGIGAPKDAPERDKASPLAIVACAILLAVAFVAGIAALASFAAAGFR